MTKNEFTFRTNANRALRRLRKTNPEVAKTTVIEPVSERCFRLKNTAEETATVSIEESASTPVIENSNESVI